MKTNVQVNSKPGQSMRFFYDYTPDQRYRSILPPQPSEDQIRLVLSADNPRCPLNKIVAGEQNAGNLSILRKFAFTALKRFNRSARGCNFLMCASPGQGKTFIVRQWAATIGIPFVFVQSSVLTDTWHLFDLIRAAFLKHEFEGDELWSPARIEHKKFSPITEDNSDPHAQYRLPPCIVFFDEAHAIKKKLMTGGLLNAMEADDGYMQIKPPGLKTDTLSVNCQNVCWVGATTERGLIFDALETRLGTTIEWAPATQDELKEIVKFRINERVKSKELPFMLPDDICEMVAKYRHIPREAISFGEKVVQHRDMFPEDDWERSVDQVAADMGLDDDGFTRKQVAILTALGQRPIAESRLAVVARCRLEEVQRYELPSLMSYINDGPYITSISGRGMCITEAGLRQLDKRGIAHKGQKVTAEHFEEKR